MASSTTGQLSHSTVTAFLKSANINAADCIRASQQPGFYCYFCGKSKDSDKPEAVKDHFRNCPGFKKLYAEEDNIQKLALAVANFPKPKKLSIMSGAGKTFTFERSPQVYYDVAAKKLIISDKPISDASVQLIPAEIRTLEIATYYQSKCEEGGVNTPQSESNPATNCRELSQELQELIEIQRRAWENLLYRDCKKFFVEDTRQTADGGFVHLAICKLCIHKCLEHVGYGSTGNVAKSMLAHIRSQKHHEKMTQFVANSWKFPFLSANLTFAQYEELMADAY